MGITQVETEDHEAQAAIFRGIDAYNDAVSGRPEPGRGLTVTLPGADGKAVGRLFGYTYYAWLHLQLLAVLPARRGRGLARRGWREFGRLDDGPPAAHCRFLARDLTPGTPAAGLAATDVLSPADVAALAGTAPLRRPLGLLVRDDAGSVVGGLWGWSELGRFFVQLLFLPERRRHAGLGSELMARAEAVARARRCRVIWLDTFSFQARPFYERLGFSCFGALADYPPGGARYFLVKPLER
jgi:GNAT superfamily N-acetyltransferase